FMMERGLWGFFNGTEKKPDNESDIAAWMKKDQKAFATLISHIGINLVSSMRMCIKLEASAHEAWKRLKTMQLNKTLHGKILARNAFYTVKMRAGELIHEYATRVEELGETFMDLGGVKLISSLHYEGCSGVAHKGGVPPPPLPPPTPLLLLLMSLVLRMSGLLLLVGSAAAARARVARVVAVAAGVVVGAAVEVVEAVEVVAVVGVAAGVGALAEAVVAAVGVAVVAAVGVVAVGLELLSEEGLAVARGSSRSIGVRPRRPSSFVSGFLRVGHLGTCRRPHTQHRCFSRLDDAWRAEFDDEAERPCWAELLRSGVAIFDLDYDAILHAIYALSVSAEGDYYLCVSHDPGIEAAPLGASESALPSTAPAEALHTFTLDSGASRYFFCDSTTLTPLSAPVPVRHADPSGGPILARSSTVLLCLAVPSGSLSGLHLPSFSTNLVSTAALQDAMVTTTTPGGLACVDLHVYTDGPSPGHVHPSAWVESVQPGYRASSGSCVCLGVCVRSGSTTLLMSPPVASDSPVAPPPWSPLPATPSWHALPPPLRRSSLLLVSLDDYSPADPLDGLRLHLRKRFRQDLPVLRLHSDRGGEFSSDLLREFCRGEGILESFTLPASPQQNGIAEHRIGLVMEVVRTSMIHAAAPHFLWPFAVRYAAHQLNLWPCVSLPETSPTLRWTGKVGDATVFRVSGSRAFVRDTSADKLSARAIPCVFLGFPPDAPGWQFYHPSSRRVLPSQDITFDKSVPFYRLFPYRSAPLPPPPLFLAPGPPPVDPLPPSGSCSLRCVSGRPTPWYCAC
ncbi:unnamed protein product, partial [Closterium sp. NIES-54]